MCDEAPLLERCIWYKTYKYNGSDITMELTAPNTLRQVATEAPSTLSPRVNLKTEKFENAV